MTAGPGTRHGAAAPTKLARAFGLGTVVTLGTIALGTLGTVTLVNDMNPAPLIMMCSVFTVLWAAALNHWREERAKAREDERDERWLSVAERLTKEIKSGGNVRLANYAERAEIRELRQSRLRGL